VREIIEKAMAKGASSCEVFYLNSLRTSVDFETGRLKGVGRTEERGATLRLVKDGRMGLATSTKLDEVDRLVDDALATSAFGGKAEIEFAGAATLPGVETAHDDVENLDIDRVIEESQAEIARILDYEGEINAEASTLRDVQEIRVLTSEGFDGSFKRTLYRHHAGGRLIEGDNMLDAYAYFGGTNLDARRDIIAEVIEDFENGRTNVGVSTGPTNVLFTPRAVADVFMTLYLGVSGAMVDRKISPLAGKLGQTVFDERVTIYDDGLAKGAYESAPFDDEGVPMQRTPVFESGVLKNFLTDLRTARKLDLPLTGNALRAKRLVLTKDLGKVPSPEVTNWRMEGGTKSSDELLAGMKEGVIIDSIMGILMSNLTAGDFSGNVAYGLKVENGKTVGRVKDTMVSGNVYKLLRDNLLDLSSDTKLTGRLGVFGTHHFPYMLLKDVPISTKG